MQFEITSPSKIIFGIGKINSIEEVIQGMGTRPLIISGVPQEISERVISLLADKGLKGELIMVVAEPTIASIHEAIDFARYANADLVIGIGGGSAIDTAKAVACLLINPGEVTDYLEVIGLNKPLTQPGLPVIAIPTTAGTGSEVTKNAVIGSPEYHVKVSLRSPLLIPKIALIDPSLTQGLPREVTAFTGMDALTQLIEPFTCNSPNPYTDALCKEGIQRVAWSLARAFDHGEELDAREDMSLASVFGGLALANARLGAVHGLAGPIGGEIPANHGAICARLLADVMEANVQALRSHSKSHPTLSRYAEIGQVLTGNPQAESDDAIQWVRSLAQHLYIQPLANYGLKEEQFPTILEKAFLSSSMKGNPVILSEESVRNILQKSLQA